MKLFLTALDTVWFSGSLLGSGPWIGIHSMSREVINGVAEKKRKTKVCYKKLYLNLFCICIILWTFFNHCFFCERVGDSNYLSLKKLLELEFSQPINKKSHSI